MPHINLLPWREEQRLYSKKEFVTVISGVAVIAVFLVGLTHFSIARIINTQNEVNSYLKTQLNIIKAEIDQGKKLETKRETLLGYVGDLNKINKERAETVLLFNQLMLATPDGVYLTQLKRSGDTVEINGIADSNTSVSQFMLNMERADEVDESVLSRIENKDKSGQGDNMFTVRLILDTTQSK